MTESKNIHWKELIPGESVIEVGLPNARFYETIDGKTVFWYSHESIPAHKDMNKRKVDMLRSRQDYLAHKCTHKEYYAQFVDDQVKATVRHLLPQIKASKDDALNDIDLSIWDALPISSNVAKKLKKHGDFLTLAGKVCIHKNAARQLREEAEKG